MASAGAGLALSLEEKILLGKQTAKANKVERRASNKDLPMGRIGKLKISRQGFDLRVRFAEALLYR